MVHLIFVCRYRKKKLLAKLGEQIKLLMFNIAKKKDFEIIETQVDQNHIHLLVSYNLPQSVLDIVRFLKQISASFKSTLQSLGPFPIFKGFLQKKVQSTLGLYMKDAQISTYRIWRQEDNHLYLQKHFWKEQTFWSDGYFACSIGNISKDIIEKYIQSLG